MFEELESFRHEHKYILPEVDMVSAKSRAAKVMKKDPHVSDRGAYNIRSLYFDDYQSRYLNENINGVDERSKWRIRIYDHDSGRISLEKKIRKSDLITKQVCLIDRDAFEAVMDRTAQILPENAPLFNVFIKEMKTSMLHPVIIVEYERTPFVCPAGNTRVTFDENIRSSSDVKKFLTQDILSTRPVLEKGQGLVEVKFDRYLPDHIAHVMENGRMRRETFSKYCLARRFSPDGMASVYR